MDRTACTSPGKNGVPLWVAPSRKTSQGECTRPYTFQDHAAKCRQAALSGVTLIGQHVQVKRRQVIYCAQILEPWTTPDGKDCWTVLSSFPEQARFTVPVHLVRECGDSRCTCVPLNQAGAVTAKRVPPPALVLSSALTPVFRQAGVVAPPDSPDLGKTALCTGWGA